MTVYNQKKLDPICRRYSIKMMYAFGSRAFELKAALSEQDDIDRSNTTDFDVGVKIAAKRTLNVKEKVTLTVELEELFQIPKVDLVVIDEADPFLAANIIRGERIFCKDTYEADSYELYILRRAGDLALLEKERLRLIFDQGSA